jgi:hypothetical protein
LLEQRRAAEPAGRGLTGRAFVAGRCGDSGVPSLPLGRRDRVTCRGVGLLARCGQAFGDRGYRETLLRADAGNAAITIVIATATRGENAEYSHGEKRSDRIPDLHRFSSCSSNHVLHYRR